MKTLTTGIIIFVFTLFFVNILLLNFLGLSSSGISLADLLKVEGLFAAFFIFLFILVTKKT